MAIDIFEAKRRGLSVEQAEDFEERLRDMKNGFESFWEIYPRKVAKKDAARAWARLTTEQQFAAIQSLPVHIKYWDLAGRTKETTPHASSWLNGERWTDELEMPAKKSDAVWWRSTAGIEAKAREVGIVPKLGEDWMSLKARVMAKVAA
jgi:hypothetical protein